MFSEKCYDRGVSSWNLKLLVWEKFFKSTSIDVDLGKKKPKCILTGKKVAVYSRLLGVYAHMHICVHLNVYLKGYREMTRKIEYLAWKNSFSLMYL